MENKMDEVIRDYEDSETAYKFEVRKTGTYKWSESENIWELLCTWFQGIASISGYAASSIARELLRRIKK